MSIVNRVWHTSEVDGRNIKKESIKIVDKTREKWDREFQEENVDKLIKQTLEVDAKWKQDNNYDISRDDMNNYLNTKKQDRKDTANMAEQQQRKVKWERQVMPLDLEAIAAQGLETEDAYDQHNLDDLINDASNHELTKVSVMQGILEPLVCEKMMNTYNWCVENISQGIPQVETDKKTIPIWSGIMMNDTEIFNDYGRIVNDVIQALMAEVTKYNEDRGCELKGVWDVPRFIEMNQGQGGSWYTDVGIGAKQALQSVGISSNREGGAYKNKADWNGQPPPSTRKYSTVICLTDGGSYDGGDVELIVDEVKTMKLNMGDVLIYPSFVSTRFLPITRGKLVLFKMFSNGNAYV